MTDQASNTNDPKKEIKINTPEPGALGASPYAAMEHPENIPDQSDALVVDTSDGTNTHVLDIDTELRGATGAVGFTVTPMPKPSAVQNPAVPIAPVQTLPPIAPPLPPLPIVVPPLAPFVGRGGDQVAQRRECRVGLRGAAIANHGELDVGAREPRSVRPTP